MLKKEVICSQPKPYYLFNSLDTLTITKDIVSKVRLTHKGIIISGA